MKFILNQSAKLRFLYAKNSKQDIKKENTKILGHLISFVIIVDVPELMNVTENEHSIFTYTTFIRLILFH